MKNSLLLFISIVLLSLSLLLSCQKNEVSTKDNSPDLTITSQVLTIDIAKTWFQSSVKPKFSKNARIDGAANKEVIWDLAVTRQTEVGQVVIVPIKYVNQIPIISFGAKPEKPTEDQDNNFTSRLVVWKSGQGAFEYRIHQVIPDKEYLRRNKKAVKNNVSGIVLVTDFDGSFIDGYKLLEGKIVGKLSSSTQNGRTANCDAIYIDYYSRVCINNNCYPPLKMYTDTYYICYESDHGSDGITPPPTVTNPTIITNNYDSNGQWVPQIGYSGPYVDVREYLKCFLKTNNSASIYRVVVYVDQAWANHRSQLYTASNDSAPGHVFIGLEETTNSQTIVRNIGFYPVSGANPVNPQDQGAVKADDRPFDVMLAIEVTQGQFTTIVNNLMAAGTSGYNLNSHNCTDYVLDATSAMGVNLPQTIGNWYLGSGRNPGDLGEDIREMTLSANMFRNGTGGYPNPAQGSCN